MEFSLSGEAGSRIEHVTQPVAEQVQPEDGDHARVA
jgi:hypothetical protein